MCAHILYGSMKSVRMQGRAPSLVAAPALLHRPTDLLSVNLKALRCDQEWMKIDGMYHGKYMKLC